MSLLTYDTCEFDINIYTMVSQSLHAAHLPPVLDPGQ
jgi:hypothetical protein